MASQVVAAVQMNAGPDLDANLRCVGNLVAQAAARGARLVALPEVFAWRGPRAAESAIATPIPGRVSKFLCRLAAEHELVVVGGSFLEPAPRSTKCYNTSLVVDRDGAIRGCYRKIHLFDADLPGQVTIRESDTRLPGTEAVTAETALGAIGLSICYDLRFPELYRALTRAGATMITVPSSFTFVTGAAHWEILLRARAIENQVYVVAPNQTGMGPHGFADYGNSLIVDPWGTVLARAADGTRVITAEVDLERVAEVRRAMPCLRHATPFNAPVEHP